MFKIVTNFHNFMIGQHINEDFICNLQKQTIFDQTNKLPFYKKIYIIAFFGTYNAIDYFFMNKTKMLSDRNYIQSLINKNNINDVEQQLKNNKNFKNYIQILHQIPIIKEMELKTDLILNDKNDLGNSIVQYTAGNCWFNVKLSHGFEIDNYERNIIDNINLASKLVEPLSEPITLFHGFENFVDYGNLNDLINVKGILSKTLSINVAKKFAYSTNSLRPKFLVIDYKKGSQHVKLSIRPHDEEFEFLSHSNETFKIVRTCKFFEGYSLLTFYICEPI